MEEIGTQEAGEEVAETIKRKVKKGKKLKDLAPTRTPRGKTKTHHTVAKDAIAVTTEVARMLRKVRAQRELQTGDRVTLSDALEYALSKVK